MLTGATLYLYLQQKWGKPYSAWLDPTKANRLVRDTVYRVMDQKYEGLASQKVYDELSILLKSNRVLTPTGNRIIVTPALILSVGNPGGLSPLITIVTLTDHHLVAGTQVTVAGIAGYVMASGSLNGSWTIVATPNSRTFTYTATGAQVTSGAYTAMSGRAYNLAATITDYYHYEYSKAKFSVTLTPTITGITVAADAVITTNVRHNLREGDNITISSVTGTGALPTNMNAAQTVTEIVSSTQFKVGVSTVGGTYASGGTLTREYYNGAVQYVSNKKIADFGQPSLEYPRVEVVEGTLLYYADKLLTIPCTEVEIDYMCKPAFDIDMNDTVTDLEQYWPTKLLYHICDAVCENFATQNRDMNLFQTSQIAMRENP